MLGRLVVTALAVPLLASGCASMSKKDCLAGDWKIFQLRRGHRYSTDDLLTAWYAVSACLEAGRTPVRVLDLGCGTGGPRVP